MVYIQENGSLLIRKINEILLFELVWNQSESIEYQTATPSNYRIVNFHVDRLPSFGNFPPENLSVKKISHRKYPPWETRRTGITTAIVCIAVWATAILRHHGGLFKGHPEIPRIVWYRGVWEGSSIYPPLCWEAKGSNVKSRSPCRDIVKLSKLFPRTFFAKPLRWLHLEFGFLGNSDGIYWWNSLAFLDQFWWNLLVETVWCSILSTWHDIFSAWYELLNDITLAWTMENFIPYSLLWNWIIDGIYW